MDLLTFLLIVALVIMAMAVLDINPPGPPTGLA